VKCLSEQRQIDVNELLRRIRKVACSKCREKIGRMELPVTQAPRVQDTGAWREAEKVEAKA